MAEDEQQNGANGNGDAKPKPARRRRSEPLRCRAMQRGEINNPATTRKVVEKGEEFVITDPALFSHRWMQAIDWDPGSTEGVPAPRELRRLSPGERRKRDQAEILAMAMKLAGMHAAQG